MHEVLTTAIAVPEPTVVHTREPAALLPGRLTAPPSHWPPLGRAGIGDVEDDAPGGVNGRGVSVVDVVWGHQADVRYAGAGGDFNPIHHDEPFAQSVGLPGVFAMGMLQGGVLAQRLAAWVGPENVKTFGLRVTGQVWPVRS